MIKKFILWGNKIGISSEEFVAIMKDTVKPYLGKREYGCRGVFLFTEYEYKKVWGVWYDDVIGSTGMINVEEIKNGTYRCGAKNQAISSPEEVMRQLRRRLDSIPKGRWRKLISLAKQRKEQGKSLEQALAEIQRLSTKEYGPNESEMQKYKAFCRRLFQDAPSS